MNKHQRLLFLIILLMPLASASAKPKCTFEDMARIFSEPPPHTKCSKRPWLQTISTFPLEQRNQIARLAAEGLLREPNIRTWYYAALIVDLNRERLITNAEVIPLLNQFAVLAGESISQGREPGAYVGWLRAFCEARLITTPAVIPHLIGALDNPDRYSVAHPAFYILTRLTLHKTGEVYWGRFLTDADTHRLVTQWWKDWWKDNNSKRPLFDLELEAEVKSEMTRLARLIEVNLKPRFSEMSLFFVPQFRSEGRPQIYVLAYSPNNYSFITTPPNIRNVWLYMEANFQTPDLPNEWVSNAKPPSFFDAAQPPEHLKNSEQEIYRKTITGSDIFISVRFASNNQTLIDAIKKLLNQ